ncbi:MAG: bifunctional DNA primase/polymerase, partial [Patescibacteria group bacterium]|nr:bifunctional DNA primase/polymerase [Patescibacteria group bacterium]
MTAPVGATAADWLHFDQVLGLGADLLPVVPDPNARAAPYSAVSKFGKIPSVYDQEDQAHGLKEWQTREITPAAVKHWSADRRYSMCVRASAARAIDVDIDSNIRADDVLETICDTLIDMGAPCLPMRRRANSAKFLMPFRLAGTWKKRRIIVHKEPLQAIEFLADGQQWVAAGSHPSGALYEWRNGLPPDIPTLTAPQFEELWRTLTEQYALDPKLSTATAEDTSASDDNLDGTVLSVIDPDTLQRVKAA